MAKPPHTLINEDIIRANNHEADHGAQRIEDYWTEYAERTKPNEVWVGREAQKTGC